MIELTKGAFKTEDDYRLQIHPVSLFASAKGWRMSRSELYRCIKSGVLRARPVGSVMRLLRDDSLATINALPAVGE